MSQVISASRLFSTVFFVFISNSLCAQNKLLDSLYTRLKKEKLGDTTKVLVLVEIAVNEYVNDSPKAKKFAEEALALSKKIGYKKGEGGSYDALCRISWAKGNYQEASQLAFQMIETFEKLNDQKGLAKSYYRLGQVHHQWKNFEQAKSYYYKAIDLNKPMENIGLEGYLTNSLGSLYLDFERLDSAMYYYQYSLSLRKQIGDEQGISQSYNNIGLVYSRQGNYREALTYFNLSLPITKKINNKTRLAITKRGLGETYLALGNYAKAEFFLIDALDQMKEMKDRMALLEINETLEKLEEQRGDFKKALFYERQKRAYQDSMFNEEKSRQFSDSEMRFETKQKEKEIQLLEQRNETQLLWRYSLIAGLTLTVIATIIIYALQRSRARKARQLLVTQQLLNQQLLEIDKTKSRFFANISHEFRTPLTLILGPIEEKLATDKLDDKDKFTFQTIKRNSNRLLELVNQLLELSKLESGNMNLKLESGNLKDALLSIISSFDSLADVNQVRYLKDVHMAEAIVLFDRDKLEKILSNLLSNAFKFTPQTGLIEFIGTTSEKGATTELQLKIRNTGPMIPTEMLNKIFEPFFQGENAAYRGMQGTGLGLSLVRELVKLHRGTVEVSSDEKGTVFTVLLKFENSLQRIDTVKQVDLVHRPIISTEEMIERENDLSIEENGKDTVLIVEDNTDVRAFIRRGLETSYHILEAPHGEAGLHLANEQIPHLIIADVMMPKMSGIDLCYQLKNNEKTSHIPVIMLTARADHESKLEGLKTGADDYLIKPFNPEELVVRVNNLIEQRKRLAQKYNQKLIVQPHEIAVSSLDERFIQKIIKVVETHLDDTQLNVDIVTTELGMSRTNLHKKLKAITGLATSEFIQDFRLRRAAQLIDKKTDNFAQIAFQVGFADQSYFTKCFKKKFGKTPSEYANLQQEN